MKKENANSMVNYEIMLKDRDGVPVNKKEAANLFKIAVDEGNENTMFKLTIILRNSEGIPADRNKASHLFTILIKKGNYK